MSHEEGNKGTGNLMPGRGLSRKHFLKLVGAGAGVAAFPGLLAACGGGGQQQSSAPKVKSVKGQLTFWYWGESDAPGANKWMNETVAAYKKKKPNLKINIVPQSTDTLISAFQAAVSANQGPDIASQWATGPVLTQVWQNAVAPISDYVPKSETDQWLNTAENTYNGKLWAMPMYLIGIAVAYNKDLYKKAGLDSAAPPKTWDEFLAACGKLKGSGITPFSLGNQDGYGGAWMFSNMELQNLDSLKEWVGGIVDGNRLAQAKYTGWYKRLDEMVKKGYFNDSINSLKLDQGHAIFSKGNSAMSLGTDGIVQQWQKDVGKDKVGVMKFPKFGTGKLAESFNATQSISHFICKWSKNKKDAAAFLTFMHTPERMKRWYELTNVGLADKRFDASAIKDPVLKQMYEWETTGPQVWLENYNPVQIDSQANIPAAQQILSKSGSPNQASQLWVQVARRWASQQPEQLKNWKSWTPAEPKGI